jgi:hypothetical protein
VRQWKRLENHPLTSPTAGETRSDDLGEPSIDEVVCGESGESSAGGGGATYVISIFFITFGLNKWNGDG